MLKKVKYTGIFFLFIFYSFFYLQGEDYLAKPYLSNPKTEGVTVAWVLKSRIDGTEVHYGEKKSYGQKASIAQVDTSDWKRANSPFCAFAYRVPKRGNGIAYVHFKKNTAFLEFLTRSSKGERKYKVTDTYTMQLKKELEKAGVEK